MSGITLSASQENAYTKFAGFIVDRSKYVFVLGGYSGTGKSTLVSTLLAQLDKLMSTARLIDPAYPTYDVKLTATTNKAAEQLARMTGREVTTIHAALGLRVHKDYATNKTKLVPRSGAEELHNTILFIDEASFINAELLKLIFSRTHKSKIVFIGDPAQLAQGNSEDLPVFSSGYDGVELTEVVRHDGPILDLATKFRNTVFTGEYFSFKPDGQAVKYLEREEFDQYVLSEFTRPDWNYHDSKVLAWTNKCAINYNNGIREHATGDPRFVEGDYAICNRFVNNPTYTIKTDQTVMITGVEDNQEQFGVRGRLYELDRRGHFFSPYSLEQWQKRVTALQEASRYGDLQTIDKNWVDLRAAYASTIDKAQGSTYGKVFLDLDDLKRCTHGNRLARLLYVGVSRASSEVILTGDLV